jgi:acetamidase/formamidase
MTGPIHVCGAEPGDVLQVDILDLWPRKNPKSGKTYGVNAAASWGYQWRQPWKSGVDTWHVQGGLGRQGQFTAFARRKIAGMRTAGKQLCMIATQIGI